MIVWIRIAGCADFGRIFMLQGHGYRGNASNACWILGRKYERCRFRSRTHDPGWNTRIWLMTSVVSLDQNDLAAPVMPLMFGHPVADRAVPTVSHHTLKFEARALFLQVRRSLRADPYGVMGLRSAEDPRLPEFARGFKVLWRECDSFCRNNPTQVRGSQHCE